MTPDIATVLPEIVLAVFAMAALLAGVYTTKDKAAKPPTDTAKAPVVVQPPAGDVADVTRDKARSVPPVQTVAEFTLKSVDQVLELLTRIANA